MRITYDPEGNVLYIELRTAEPVNSRDLEEGVTADLDAEGHIIGLEILDARERLGENQFPASRTSNSSLTRSSSQTRLHPIDKRRRKRAVDPTDSVPVQPADPLAGLTGRSIGHRV